MKHLIKSPLLLLLVFALNGSAQTVPSFTGETAENKSVTIPSDTKGKFTFICFAGSKGAQKDLEGWLDPVYNKFIAKTGLMDEFYDVNIYFIPVFRGANATMTETIKRRFRESAQKDLWAHVLFTQSELKEVSDALQMRSDDIPYFFLLDKDGSIIYRTSGAFTEKKFDDIDEKME